MYNKNLDILSCALVKQAIRDYNSEVDKLIFWQNELENAKFKKTKDYIKSIITKKKKRISEIEKFFMSDYGSVWCFGANKEIYRKIRRDKDGEFIALNRYPAKERKTLL